VKKNPKRKLKLLWELNPNMAYISWSLKYEKKKPKRKLKLLWELNPNMAYVSWSLNYGKKTQKKAPQIFVWLSQDF
jgi:fructose-1,6-bisphosphatase